MLPLPVHSYGLNARSAASSRLVNVYAEAGPQGGKSPVILRTAPGIAPHVTLTGGGRGLHACKLGLFALAGNTLYKIAGGSAQNIGTIPGTQLASFSDNGASLVIGTGGQGYLYGGTLTQITDPDFTARSPAVPVFLDNYIVWIDEGSGQFFSSDLTAAGDYDGLDFATAESAPDNLVTQAVDHRQLVLVGTQTTELWYNAGANGFPFERVPGGVIEIGGIAKHGIAKQDNSVFWLANDRTFRRLNGQTPLRVSTHGVEEKWRDYAVVSDAQCFPFTTMGHLCVAVRFPSASACWVYDASTNEWHERESYLGLPWRVSSAVEFNGTTYVQDAETGSVGILSGETFTEWGSTLRAEWTYTGVWDGGRRVFHQELELGVETGVGLATGQGVDPMVSLHVSDDGGRTYRTLPVKSIGRQGEYKRRVRWHRLGSASHRVYKASFSDPVPLTVWDTQIRVA
jgi:hypothetical protein